VGAGITTRTAAGVSSSAGSAEREVEGRAAVGGGVAQIRPPWRWTMRCAVARADAGAVEVGGAVQAVERRERWSARDESKPAPLSGRTKCAPARCRARSAPHRAGGELPGVAQEVLEDDADRRAFAPRGERGGDDDVDRRSGSPARSSSTMSRRDRGEVEAAVLELAGRHLGEPQEVSSIRPAIPRRGARIRSRYSRPSPSAAA